MDSNCHAGNKDSYTDIEKDDGIVSYLLIDVRGDEPHIGIDKTAETDDWYGGWGRVANRNKIECDHVTDAARYGSVALMENIKVDGSMEDVLMKERIADALPKSAAIIQAHAIIAHKSDTHYYNVPSIKRNLLFRSS